MTSHPSPLALHDADMSVPLGKHSGHDFAEMPRRSHGQHQPQDCDGMGLLPATGNRLHGKRSAAKHPLMNVGVVKEAVQRDFLHCKRLIEGRVSFFGHRSVPFRLYDGIVARAAALVPLENIIERREYSALVTNCISNSSDVSRLSGDKATTANPPPVPAVVANNSVSVESCQQLQATGTAGRDCFLPVPDRGPADNHRSNSQAAIARTASTATTMMSAYNGAESDMRRMGVS